MVNLQIIKLDKGTKEWPIVSHSQVTDNLNPSYLKLTPKDSSMETKTSLCHNNRVLQFKEWEAWEWISLDIINHPWITQWEEACNSNHLNSMVRVNNNSNNQTHKWCNNQWAISWEAVCLLQVKWTWIINSVKIQWIVASVLWATDDFIY